MTQASMHNLHQGTKLPPLRLNARNTSVESSNTIHHDADARQYGYAGGLVPGVTLYAYLTQLAVSFYGAVWLERGTADFSVRRPVYDGETVVCEGTVVSGVGDGLALDLRVLREDGPHCAGGIFALAHVETDMPARLSAAPPAPNPLPLVSLENGPPIGVPLSPLDISLSEKEAASYADFSDDHNPWYRGASPFGGALVPPGWLAQRQSPLLRANFRFTGPSIHVRSVIRHLAPAFAGRTYRTNGVICDAFERKGNQYLVLDAETSDDHDRIICRVEHTWIWKVREADSEPAH
jgi:acyl dehydratase